MCMRVDLPEPEGPMIAVKRAGREPDGDAVESADRGLAFAVHAHDVGSRYQQGFGHVHVRQCAKRTGGRRYGCPYAVP